MYATDPRHCASPLDARVGNLLVLNAGALAGINRVRLQISGVKAEAQLFVHLDKVQAILERALKTLDNNPQIVNRVLQSVDASGNIISPPPSPANGVTPPP